MSGKSRTRAPKQRLVPEDLEQVVREALRGVSGLNLANLKGRLPVPYQPFAKEAQAIARDLAERGEVPCFKPTKTQLVFFSEDPVARLEAVLQSHLQEPVTEKELIELVAEQEPGFEVIVKSWLSSAVKGQRVHAYPPRESSQSKRYHTEPDARAALKTVLTALQKALAKTDKLGIGRERIATILVGELGVSSASVSIAAAPSNGGRRPRTSRSDFVAELDALASENPRQSMLSVSELRGRLALEKREFDAIALDLAREGTINLHHHDNAASMPERDRSELVQDGRGTDYVGISLTRGV